MADALLSITFKSTTGTIAYGQEVYDKEMGAYQGDINKGTKSKLDSVDASLTECVGEVTKVSSVASQALAKANDAETAANSANETIQSVVKNSVTGGQTEDGTSLSVSGNNIIIPMASSSTAGVVKLTDSFTTMSGYLLLSQATQSDIVAKEDYFKPLMSSNVDDIVRVGITSNSQELTSDEKSKAQKWLGVTQDWVGTQAEYDALTEFDENVKYYIV